MSTFFGRLSENKSKVKGDTLDNKKYLNQCNVFHSVNHNVNHNTISFPCGTKSDDQLHALSNFLLFMIKAKRVSLVGLFWLYVISSPCRFFSPVSRSVLVLLYSKFRLCNSTSVAPFNNWISGLFDAVLILLNWTRTSTGRPVVFTLRWPRWRYGTPWQRLKQPIFHLFISIIISCLFSLKCELEFQRPASRTFASHGDHHNHSNQYYHSCCHSHFHLSFNLYNRSPRSPRISD